MTKTETEKAKPKDENLKHGSDMVRVSSLKPAEISRLKKEVLKEQI